MIAISGRKLRICLQMQGVTRVRRGFGMALLAAVNDVNVQEGTGG